MERINSEYYVSLKIAKLLAKAGFNWKVNHHYPNVKSLGDNDKGCIEECSFYEDFNNNGGNSCSCPTLDVAQRWFREVKNIQIIASPLAGSKKWTPLICKDFYLLHEDIDGIALTSENFNTYEEALEVGIKKVLEMILEKGK